jgi:hypothetical protein
VNAVCISDIGSYEAVVRVMEDISLCKIAGVRNAGRISTRTDFFGTVDQSDCDCDVISRNDSRYRAAF